MKKLQEWLLGLSTAVAVWVFLLKESQSASSTLHSWNLEIRIAPVIVVLLFGVYAASVVLYRVYTFNDCKEAAEELNKEIEQARKDLKRRGFKF